MMPDFTVEKSFLQQVVAGIDEAGRGPLAGPVVAAAVIANKKHIISGVNDSKKISAKLREEIYKEIIANYHYAIGVVSHTEIDEINILEATKKACKIADSNLLVKPDIVLVDGNMKFPDNRYHSIVKGDSKSYSIAAASIIAKVTRDKMMLQMHEEFPKYKWNKNFGYGTKEHIEAIIKYGLTPYHRISFTKKILASAVQNALR